VRGLFGANAPAPVHRSTRSRWSTATDTSLRDVLAQLEARGHGMLVVLS